MNKSLMLSIVKITCLFVFLAFCGCEDKASVSDVDTYFRNNGMDSSPGSSEVALAMEIDPAAVILSSNGDQVAFDVNGGIAPYTWSVVDISVGSILAQGGYSAVYERTASGDNTVKVVDSVGNVAFAVVSQP